MKSRIKILSSIMVMIAISSLSPVSMAQDMKMKKGDSKMKMNAMEFNKWPMASQMALKSK